MVTGGGEGELAILQGRGMLRQLEGRRGRGRCDDGAMGVAAQRNGGSSAGKGEFGRDHEHRQWGHEHRQWGHKHRQWGHEHRQWGHEHRQWGDTRVEEHKICIGRITVGPWSSEGCSGSVGLIL